jgi:hypothetical protein
MEIFVRFCKSAEKPRRRLVSLRLFVRATAINSAERMKIWKEKRGERAQKGVKVVLLFI